jgi:hypothetical protein
MDRGWRPRGAEKSGPRRAPRPPSAMARPDGAGAWALSDAAGGRGPSRGEGRSEGSGAAHADALPSIRAQMMPLLAARSEAANDACP